MKAAAVILVKFPFTSLDTSKKRPALVLNSVQLTAKIEVVTVAMITSQIDGLKLSGDVLMEDWKQAGLLHPSIIRLAKVATIEKDLIEKELGRVSNKDLRLTKASFCSLYKYWTG